MLTEQIIEFKLRGLVPLVVHVLVQLVIFMTKQKSRKKTFEWIIARGNVLYFSLPRPKTTKFNHKIQDFKRVLDLNED